MKPDGPWRRTLDAPPLSDGIGLAVVFVVGMAVVGYPMWVDFRVVRGNVNNDVATRAAEMRTR